MSRSSFALVVLAAFAAGTAHAEVTRTLRATLSGEASEPFAVENLAGTMTVTAADVATVEAVATVHAGDDELAGAVTFEQVSGREGRPTLLVRYPVHEHHTFRYAGSGSSTVEYDGHRVKVSSRSGVELWADVEVRVPRHVADAAFFNHVGQMKADGLDGVVRLDTASADITAKGLSGKVAADTGSGDVRVEAIRGTFKCDTGSGACVVTGFAGDSLTCDTGSGDVRVSDADAEDLRADTGSGDVTLQLSGARTQRVRADTGSGSVTVQLPADASFELDADVGSGDIVSHFSDAQPVIHHREVIGYRRGDGGTRISVDTGSGDVTVAPR